MNHNRKRFIIYLIDSLEGFQELTPWMAFGVVFIWLNPGPGDKQPRASVFHTSHWIPCFLHLIMMVIYGHLR